MSSRQDTSGLSGLLRDALGGVEPPAVTGSAGGGSVTVTLRGLSRAEEVCIAEEAFADHELLADLVAAAITDALRQAKERQVATAESLLRGLGAGREST